MRTWVRYSVAVYLGLMIAGAIGMQKPQSTEAKSVYPVGVNSPFPHELYPHTWRKPAGQRHRPSMPSAADEERVQADM